MIMSKLTDLCQEILFPGWKSGRTDNLDRDDLDIGIDLVTDHILDRHQRARQ